MDPEKMESLEIWLHDITIPLLEWYAFELYLRYFNENKNEYYLEELKRIGYEMYMEDSGNHDVRKVE